jgi:hypothetical protein
MWFFKVNVVVSHGSFLRFVKQVLHSIIKEALLSLENYRRCLNLTPFHSPISHMNSSL